MRFFFRLFCQVHSTFSKKLQFFQIKFVQVCVTCVRFLLFSLFCIKKHFVGLQTRNRQINMICYKEKLFSSKFFAKEKSSRNLSVTLITFLLKNFTLLSDVSWFSKASCKVLLLRSDYFLAQSLAAASTTDFFYLMVFRFVNLNPGADPNSYDITNG